MTRQDIDRYWPWATPIQKLTIMAMHDSGWHICQGEGMGEGIEMTRPFTVEAMQTVVLESDGNIRAKYPANHSNN